MAYNKKKSVKNNYFMQSIQRYGTEKFIEYLSNQKYGLMTLENDVPRIARDIIKGKIEIDAYAEYLSNPILVQVMVNTMYKISMKYYVWWTSSYWYCDNKINSGVEPTVDEIYARDEAQRIYNVWLKLYTGFNNFSVSYDINILKALQASCHPTDAKYLNI